MSSKVENGKNVYSQDDIIIGKVMVSMAKMGINRKNNFRPEKTMPMLADTFQKVAENLIEDFRQATVNMKESEREELARRGHEIMGGAFLSSLPEVLT